MKMILLNLVSLVIGVTAFGQMAAPQEQPHDAALCTIADASFIGDSQQQAQLTRTENGYLYTQQGDALIAYIIDGQTHHIMQGKQTFDYAGKCVAGGFEVTILGHSEENLARVDARADKQGNLTVYTRVRGKYGILGGKILFAKQAIAGQTTH